MVAHASGSPWLVGRLDVDHRDHSFERLTIVARASRRTDDAVIIAFRLRFASTVFLVSAGPEDAHFCVR